MEFGTGLLSSDRQCLTQIQRSQDLNSLKIKERVPRRVITLITNKKTYTQPINNDLANISPSLVYTESQELMSSRTFVQSIPLEDKLGNILNRLNGIDSQRRSSVMLHDSFADLHYNMDSGGLTVSKMQKQRLVLESSQIGYRKKASQTKKLSQRARMMMKTQKIQSVTGDKFYRYTQEIKRMNLIEEYEKVQHAEIVVKTRKTIKLLPLQKKTKPHIVLKSIELKKNRRQTIATHREVNFPRSRRISTMVYETPGKKAKFRRQSTTVGKNYSLRRSGLRVFSSSVGKDKNRFLKFVELESNASCACLHLNSKKSAIQRLRKDDEEQTGCWS